MVLLVSAPTKRVSGDVDIQIGKKEAQFFMENVHIEISGPETGAPVLLLHGWGSSAALMQPLAKAIQDTYRVYNVDLPGHGESPPPSEAWGVPQYAALVDRILRERVGEPAHIVGHSNGGRIALFMAGDSGLASHIRSLALISPSGVKRQRSFSYYMRKWAATIMKAPFQVMPGPLKTYGLDWLRHTLFWRMLGSSDYARLSGVMRETFVKTVNCYVEDRLERIEVPALLFWGTEDEMITREQMQRLEQSIDDAALIELEGASHYGYLDKPGIVVPALRHFIQHQPTTDTALVNS